MQFLACVNDFCWMFETVRICSLPSLCEFVKGELKYSLKSVTWKCSWGGGKMEGKGEGAVTLPALLSEESVLHDIQLCGLSTNHLFRITLREIMCCVLNNCLVIHCYNLTTTTTGSFFAFQRGLPAYANAILGNLVWLAISSHLLNFPLLKQCLGCSSNVEHRKLGEGGMEEPTSLSLPPPCTSATPPRQSTFLKILDLHPF